jgi:hypothetical protein
MTVAPRASFVGLLGQGNPGNDGSLEAVLAHLDAEHPDAILDFLCTGTDQMMARYGVPETRLRWYNTQTQRAPGVTALAAKSLMVALGMIVDAFRIGTWVRCHDVVMVSGMGVLETSLRLRSWHTPYSMFLVSAFALPTPRDVSVVAGMIGVGVMDYHRSNDNRRQADQLHASHAEKMKNLFLWLVDNGQSAEPEDVAAGHEHTRTDPF